MNETPIVEMEFHCAIATPTLHTHIIIFNFMLRVDFRDIRPFSRTFRVISPPTSAHRIKGLCGFKVASLG